MKNKIKYFVMDVDGTLTDGKIYMGMRGEQFKVFNIKDGYAINKMLPLNGITPVIITGRNSKITENRCMELGIKELHQEVANKEEVLRRLLQRDCAEFSQVAYIGDDLNDLSCMEIIKRNGGITGCPADAVPEVKNICDFISLHKGGEGAVRDFIEYLTDRK